MDELLDIDREYRQRTKDGSLATIKPTQPGTRREPWLPVMHTDREGRHYTAMFSNTARAKEQHATHDWVIIFRDDADAEGSWTVITAQFAKLKGFRIVRGRDEDCQEHYRRQNAFHVREAGHAPYPEIPSEWEEEDERRGVYS